MNGYEYSDEVLKNGVVGKLSGYRIGGKSYDTEGNQIEEVHEEDCYCCCKNLFAKKSTPPPLQGSDKPTTCSKN